MLCSSGFTLYKVYTYDQKGILRASQVTYTQAAIDSETTNKTQPTNKTQTAIRQDNTYHEIQVKDTFEPGRDILYVAQPNFLALQGYRLHNNGQIKSIEPFWRFIYPYFDISAFDQSDTFVLKLNSVVSVTPIRILSSEDFFSLQGWLITYKLFSIGIVFALFLLNVAFALILKDKSFTIYAVFLACSQLYMFTSSGLSRLAVNLSGYSFMAFGFGTLWMVLYFLKHYLSMNERLPIMARISKFTMIIVALGVPFSLVSAAFNWAIGLSVNYMALSILGAWVSFFTFAVLWRYLRKDFHLTPYFLTGSALQAITVLFMIFSLYEWWLKSPIFQIAYMAAASINCVFFTLGMIEQLKDVREQGAVFYNLAITDRLTKAYNRFYFETQIHEFMSGYSSFGGNAVLVLLDIDHFKRINDTYGHHVGDQVLQNLVQLLQRHLRRSDRLFRWGGEEFVILMEGITQDQAIESCERLRKVVADHQFPTAQKVTVSAGVAAFMGHESLDEWFKQCDAALYSAKASGRNCVHTVP